MRAQHSAGYADRTVRLRGTLLTEYLEHVLNEEKATSLTAGELVQSERADSWLDAADAGETRRRNTLTGPDAAAAPDSQRARIGGWTPARSRPGSCAGCRPPRNPPGPPQPRRLDG
ncbi:hypothetical protein [Streptomyces sp. NPDC057363]|uniref:hypothetical protein n=1 Tax=Streptomyces sp. NPDC057363 TaxID=3346107 RepID=UPI00363DE4B9